MNYGWSLQILWILLPERGLKYVFRLKLKVFLVDCFARNTDLNEKRVFSYSVQ
jgi:hypothetical protein